MKSVTSLNRSIVAWVGLLWLAGTLALPAAGFRHWMNVGVTNAPTNDAPFVVNGATRYWATNVTNASIQIPLTNDIGWLRTNLYLHILANPFSGPVTLQWGSSTNDVVLIGATNQVVTGSAAGWGTVTVVTNPVYGASPMTVPFSPAHTESFRQWMMSEFSLMLTNSTNPIPALAIAVRNLLNTTTNAQTVTNKSFVGGNFAGRLSGAWLETNGTLWLTNGQVNLVSVTNAGRVWLFNASPNNSNHVMTYYDVISQLPTLDTNTFRRDTDVDPNVWYFKTNGLLVSPVIYGGETILEDVVDATAGGFIAGASTPFVVSQDGNQLFYFNSQVEEFSAQSVFQYGSLNAGQFTYNAGVFGSVSLKPGLSLTNPVVRGMTNAGAIVHQAGAVGSLADGVNMAIPLPAIYLVEMSGGSGIVQLNGFKGSGVDGETHELRLSGAKTNIVVHEASGTYTPDSATTNRIVINAPGDYLTLTNNGWANILKLRYRSAASRWEVLDAR